MNEFLKCGRYTFNFTRSGLFTLVDKEGEPIYDQALPLFEKLMSHLVWIFFWLVLILSSHIVFPANWISLTDRLFMGMVFFHLFVFGCRLTTLMIKGGLKPIIFPPLWIRLTRKFQKGKNIELLQQYHLENHPGLLTNLALVQYNQQQVDKAYKTINRALSFAPDHPVLLELFKAFGRASAEAERTKLSMPDSRLGKLDKPLETQSQHD